MGVSALPALALPRAAPLAVSVLWARGVIAILALLGVRQEIRGNPPRDRRLLASLHQSAWETIAFHPLLGNPRYLMKKSLFWLPFVGLYLKRLGMIGVDRRRPRAAVQKLLASAERAEDSEGPLVIFPAGTRTPVGAKVTLKSGTWALYRRGCAITPCVLNSGRIMPPGRQRIYRGLITALFLPPVAAGLGRRDFEKKLAKAMSTDPLSFKTKRANRISKAS